MNSVHLTFIPTIAGQMLPYNSTPYQEICHRSFDKAGIRVLVKREDLNHPFVSGNKWWKLKYNLAEALSANQPLLTFGGAYSNHIYATAAATAEINLKSFGIIRGEETLPLNPTLQFASDHNMQLHYVTRDAYRNKGTPEFISYLHQKFGSFFLVPEGGTNQLAVKGCAEFGKELSQQNFDYLCLPVGTGGTMAGLICGLSDTKDIIGFSVLRNGEFLKAEVAELAMIYSGVTYKNWRIVTQYHHGGYAKVTPELLSFIKEMSFRHALPLDRVYTAKLFWGVINEAESGTFKKGSTVMVLHTGGLQGSIRNQLD